VKSEWIGNGKLYRLVAATSRTTEALTRRVSEALTENMRLFAYVSGYYCVSLGAKSDTCGRTKNGAFQCGYIRRHRGQGGL